MTSPKGAELFCDNLERSNEIAMALCHLALSNEWAEKYCIGMKNFMEPADRMQMAGYVSQQKNLYWKYWKRLVHKIKGIKEMDKKMHKVTEQMRVAEKDVKEDKPKQAVKVLKKAEKKNERLVKIDRDVRDPMIEKCKKSMKKSK